jgi:hypothetical protein
VLVLVVLCAACGGITRRGQDQAARIERELDSLEETSDSEPTDDAYSRSGHGSLEGSAVDAQAPPTTEAPATPASRTDRAVDSVSGKGQYLYRMEKSGTPEEVVAKAKAHGLRHLVIRAGNSEDGFYTAETLDGLLPLAHAAGIRVVAYDGPAMQDIPADVARAASIANFTASTGDRIDALGLDIERVRAPDLSGPLAAEYGTALRSALPDFPLIGIVMNPNYHLKSYPFTEIAAFVDVLSPMNYWSGVTKDSAAFMRTSMELLAPFGKPVSIIGQAYPIEGKRTYPTTEQFLAQMQAAKDSGAVGISFWAWEYTRDDSWAVIRDFSW